MDTSELLAILYITFFVWLLPPIRQYKTEYFWYFVALILPDFFTLTICRITQIPSLYFTPLSVFLVLPTLINFKKLNSFTFPIIAIYFGVGIYATLHPWTFALEYVALVHTVVLLIFIQHTLKSTQSGSLNMFYIILVLYELTLIIKCVVLINNYFDGLARFYVTSVFQVLLGIFFFIYRIDNPKLLIPLKKDD